MTMPTVAAWRSRRGTNARCVAAGDEDVDIDVGVKAATEKLPLASMFSRPRDNTAITLIAIMCEGFGGHG